MFCVLLLAPLLASASPTDSAKMQGEEAVDLGTLDESSDSAGARAAPSIPGHPASAGGHKEIEVIAAVDMTLEHMKGEDKTEATFSTNHEYVVIGIHPQPSTVFLIEVISVTYWEFQYFLSRNTRLKFGKIAVPFGPLFLHSILGGVVGKPRDGGGETALLLPLEWAEYGFGWEQRWVDGFAWSLETKAWLVNGLSGRAAPERLTVDITDGAGKNRDNNRDKGAGARFENRFFGKFGLNFSFYTCRWSPETDEDKDRWFYEGDRLFLGNADFELGYGFLPLPLLRNFRIRGEYALMRTRSTVRNENQDLRVPWHDKTADMAELSYNGFGRYFDLRFRAGRYDDNTRIKSSRDLINFNAAVILKPVKGLQVIPAYLWNRERVNETPDDFFFTKFFVEL